MGLAGPMSLFSGTGAGEPVRMVQSNEVRDRGAVAGKDVPMGESEGMGYFDQMATKLLAQAVRDLGMALNECLCVEPDRAVVLSMVADVRRALAEFDTAYGEDQDARQP